MPKKSKEELLEKDIIDSKKISKTRPSTVKAKTTAKKETAKKVAKKDATSTKSETISKKVSTSKSNVGVNIDAIASSKKTSSKAKSSTVKKSTTNKSNTKTKSSSTAKKAKTSSKVSKKSSKAKSSKITKKILSNKPKKLSSITLKKIIDSKDYPFILEYYDLPYKYNKTVIKALAQNPNTLFVYWEISDEDINSLNEKYGDNIFDLTRPVLIIHNLTDKYSFEININDFANNWYIHVNDSKCQYVVELGRRPKENNILDKYLYITSSNMIEAPNDHVLFYDSEQIREVRFKNIHTNKYTTKVIKPFLKSIYELYGSLHLSKENGSFDFKNPSSQNPTSNVF